MYQLNQDAPHYEMIGDKGQQQPYDETYLQTIANIKLKFSGETKQIQQQFNDDGIISSKDWKGYDWIMLCIAYCLAKNNQIDKWENADEKGIEISIDTLFQNKLAFWTAFISEQMFQSQQNKDYWKTEDFAKWVKSLAHNGALALKQRWEETLQFHKKSYKALSAFLTELAEIAAKNMPKENNVSGSLKPEPQPVSKDISGSLKTILEKCKIPAETVKLSSTGVRYDIYEVKFYGVTELDKKTDDIAAYLGISENSVIAGGQVIGNT